MAGRFDPLISVNREKLNQLSYGMRHRIVEIAHLAAADERVFDVHPEVSFVQGAARVNALPKANRVGRVGAAPRTGGCRC
jgi:hypothetical protein